MWDEPWAEHPHVPGGRGSPASPHPHGVSPLLRMDSYGFSPFAPSRRGNGRRELARQPEGCLCRHLELAAADTGVENGRNCCVRYLMLGRGNLFKHCGPTSTQSFTLSQEATVSPSQPSLAGRSPRLTHSHEAQSPRPGLTFPPGPPTCHSGCTSWHWRDAQCKKENFTHRERSTRGLNAARDLCGASAELGSPILSHVLGFNLLLLLMGNSFMQRHVQGNPSALWVRISGLSPHLRPALGLRQNSSGLLFPSAVSLQTQHARPWQSKCSVSLEVEYIPSLLLVKGGWDVSARLLGSSYLQASIFEALGWKSSCSVQSKDPDTNLGREFTAVSENKQINKDTESPPVTWQLLPPHPWQPPSSVCSVTAPHHPPGEHHGNTVVFKHRSLCCNRKQH